MRFRHFPEPSTAALGWGNSRLLIESCHLHEACRPFDRGATMPYVQRKFRF
jgi:hypothetical protein